MGVNADVPRCSDIGVLQSFGRGDGEERRLNALLGGAVARGPRYPRASTRPVGGRASTAQAHENGVIDSHGKYLVVGCPRTADRSCFNAVCACL
jgi:hypothetical protein